MNTKEVLYDNGLMRLEYDANEQCLYHIWENFTRTEEYKETLQTLKQVVIDLQPTKLLVDQRKRKILPKDASMWFVQEWFPNFAAILQTNLRIAFVDAEDIFGKVTAKENLKQLHQQYQMPALLQYQSFDDIEIAEKWLNL